MTRSRCSLACCLERLSGSVASLTWTPFGLVGSGSIIEAYNVWRSTNGGVSFELLQTIPVTQDIYIENDVDGTWHQSYVYEQPYEDTSSAPGYRYYVQGVQIHGQSTVSNTVLPTLNTLVLDPIDQTFVSPNNFNDLTWTNTIVPTTYDIWRSFNGGPFAYLVTTPGATTTYSDNIGQTAGTYSYYVLAKDAFGDTLETSNVESTVLVTNYTTLLIPCNEGNGSTNFQDISVNGFTVSRANGAVMSNAQTLFGQASSFDCTTPFLAAPYIGVPVAQAGPIDLTQMSNWTLEFWVYVSTTNPSMVVCDASANQSTLFIMFLNIGPGSNQVGLTHLTSGWLNGATLAPGNLNIGAWNHVAIGMSGNTAFFIGLNGVLASAIATPANLPAWPPGQSIYFANSPISTANTQYHLYDIRISSIARYSGSTYTVPTAPFSATG